MAISYRILKRNNIFGQCENLLVWVDLDHGRRKVARVLPMGGTLSGGALTVLGHNYVGSSREVLSDIFHLFKSNTAPEDRFTVNVAGSVGNMHWKLKD